ncbi:hypothetical protein ACJX0J_022604, partial [Zea mays]
CLNYTAPFQWHNILILEVTATILNGSYNILSNNLYSIAIHGHYTNAHYIVLVIFLSKLSSSKLSSSSIFCLQSNISKLLFRACLTGVPVLQSNILIVYKKFIYKNITLDSVFLE